MPTGAALAPRPLFEEVGKCSRVIYRYATARGVGTHQRISLHLSVFVHCRIEPTGNTWCSCNNITLVFVSFAVTAAAVRTSSHGHTDRRPVANSPIRPHFFATSGSGDELTWPCWHVKAALSPCNFRTVVSACPDALVCESPKPWRTAFAHGMLTPDGLQHLGMSSTDLGLQKPSQFLMLKNLKPSTPLSREAHANRQFMVFSWLSSDKRLRSFPARQEKSTTTHASLKSGGSRAVRGHGKWFPTTHQSVLEPSSFLTEIGNRRPTPQELALHGQIGSLRRRWRWALAARRTGVLGRKHRQKRKKSIWTTEEITPFPGRTGVQVQGGTSSRSADAEETSVHRRRDGAQDWCRPAGCVLSGERVPGRNEAIWVHVRNCLHACNRRQVRLATNKEADGLEMVRNWIPEFFEDVRRGRLQH